MWARPGGCAAAAAAARGVVWKHAQAISLHMAPAAMRSWSPLGPRLPVWTHVRRKAGQFWHAESAGGARALHTVMDCSGEKSLRSAVPIAAGTEVLAEAGRVLDAPSMHTIQFSDVSVGFFAASLRGGSRYPATMRAPRAGG